MKVKQFPKRRGPKASFSENRRVATLGKRPTPKIPIPRFHSPTTTTSSLYYSSPCGPFSSQVERLPTGDTVSIRSLRNIPGTLSIIAEFNLMLLRCSPGLHCWPLCNFPNHKARGECQERTKYAQNNYLPLIILQNCMCL